MHTPIPLSVPSLEGNAWRYVKDCIDTNWVSSAGPYVDRFEQQFAEQVGCEHAVAVSTGTAALHLALLVAGVKADEEVLVSTLTFIASANAIRYVGAWPVFVDAEPNHWQIDPQLVEDFLRGCQAKDGKLINPKTGRRLRAIMPVHILGHPVALDPILELAKKYDLFVIEDAAESLGARYKNRPVGSLGDAACFSFNGNKTITTGGGGMLTTNDTQLAERARYLSTQAKDSPQEYIHGEVGYNYRLPNLLAALGCSQLEMLPQFIERKRQIAAHYLAAFANLPGVRLQPEAAEAFSSCWLSTVQIDAAEFGRDARQLQKELAKANIQTRPLWQPMHQSPAFHSQQLLNSSASSSASPTAILSGVADRLYETCLSLPSSVDLHETQLQTVSERVIALSSNGKKTGECLPSLSQERNRTGDSEAA